jgi:ABC-type lipoprotein release transport system permease subunit
MRAFGLLLQLAWRNLWRNTRRNLILAVAVALGVATLLVAVAIVRGWQGDLQDDTVIAAGGHLKVLAPGYRDEPDARFAFVPPTALLASLDAARVPWTTRIALPVVIMSERETRGVQLLAGDIAWERQHGALADARIRGTPLAGPDDGRLLLGAELARRLETRPGKRVVLMLGDADGVTHEVGMLVAGTYDVDGTGTELGVAYTGLRALQPLLAAERRVTEVALHLPDERALARWRQDLGEQLPALESLTWRELSPQGAALIAFVDGSIWITFVIFLAALSFGVTNTLVAAVLERARELGLMFVLGMRRGQVVVQVLVESVFVVTLGLLLGLAAGGLWVWSLADGIDLTRWAAGIEMAGMKALLVPDLWASDVVLVSLLVVVLGMLGAIYPAWRAVRLDPLEALHGRKH